MLRRLFVHTYLTADVRLWYQSLKSSWLLDMSRSLAWGKVSWKEKMWVEFDQTNRNNKNWEIGYILIKRKK